MCKIPAPHSAITRLPMILSFLFAIIHGRWEGDGKKAAHRQLDQPTARFIWFSAASPPYPRPGPPYLSFHYKNGIKDPLTFQVSGCG